MHHHDEIIWVAFRHIIEFMSNKKLCQEQDMLREYICNAMWRVYPFVSLGCQGSL